MSTIACTHTLCIAHRAYKMPGKQQSVHGHNMTVRLTMIGDECQSFERLSISPCRTLTSWLTDHWDYRLLLWLHDPLTGIEALEQSLCILPFNPSAENIAHHLLHNAGPTLLAGTDMMLSKVNVSMTPEISAEACR